MLRFFFILNLYLFFAFTSCDAHEELSLSSATPFIKGVNVLTGKVSQSSVLGVEYEMYQEGWNQLRHESVQLQKEDFRIGKVRKISIKEKEQFSHPTYLIYEPGLTQIEETPNIYAFYYYVEPGLIQSIEYYQKEPNGIFQLDKREWFFWQKGESVFHLVRHVLENQAGQSLRFNDYVYNSQGLLIQERLVDNLSQKGFFAFEASQKSNSNLEKRDSYPKSFIAATDESMLLPARLDNLDNKDLVIDYQYDSLTKQCTAMLQSYQNKVVARCFYFYNSQGFLEKAIHDNGQSSQPDDLTGVTQRQIIDLEIGQQVPLIGKPLKIARYDWDPNCQNAEGDLFYQLTFTYDEEGELLSALDNQGQVIVKANPSLSDQNDRMSKACDLMNSNIFNNAVLTHEIQDKQFNLETISISQLWTSLSQAFFSGFNYLQAYAHQTHVKWNNEFHLPVPLGKALEKISKTFFGDAAYLLMGPNFESTRVDCYGQREIHDKVRVTFINGILNTRHMMLESLDIISESHGGIKVHYVFRPTGGWTWDIARAIMIRTAFSLGFRSLHCHLLAQIWREMIQEMGGIEGGGVIVHYAHSLGGSETDRARELLTPEEQKMIRVVTFGAATLIRNIGFQSVMNIVSVNDGVSSFILEPFGHIRNYFDTDTNVHYYSSFFQAPIWPTDHCLNGPTYGPILRKMGEKFLEEFISDVNPMENDQVNNAPL